MKQRWPAVVLGLAAAPLAAAPALYRLTVETSMPHLEWNLRYATVTEERCLDPDDLSGAFWMLREPGLQDCRLEKQARRGDADDYRLVCTAGHGTEGRARWQIGDDRLDGRLDVRLGAKNMTFYQQATALRLGPCR